jgi:GntR family transcriptional repressor for pyruvate dehydrogenase complex
LHQVKQRGAAKRPFFKLTNYITAMHIPQIRVPTVVDSIVEHFEELILEGVLAPGSRLPAERKLAQSMGVSRTSIRLALAQLNAKGLVSFDGRSIHICSVFDSLIGEPLNKLLLVAPTDLKDLWRVLIRPVAELAAKRHTQHDIDHLRKTIEDIETASEAKNKNECAKAIKLYFDGLAAATYNFLFFQIINIFGDIVLPCFDLMAEEIIKQSEQGQRLFTVINEIETAIAENDTATAVTKSDALIDSIILPSTDALQINAERRQQERRGDLEDVTLKAIEFYIDEEKLKPGDALPDPASLARQLGAATTAVQGALSKLEAMGAMEFHSPVFVIVESIDSLEDPLIKLVRGRASAVSAIFEFRMALEKNIAYLAATQRSSKDLVLLQKAFDLMASEVDGDPENYALYDINFHIAISSVCGKITMGTAIKTLMSLFRSVTSRWLSLHQQKRGDLKAIHQQHELIFEAIVAGDGDGARDAMRQHLEYVIQNDRLFEQMDQRIRISDLRREVASE